MRRKLVASVAMVFVLSQAVQAQAPDPSRLTIGISGGYIGAVSLFDISGQPVQLPPRAPSMYHLSREFGANVAMSGQVTYFRDPRLGFSAEFTYLGLGTVDHCTLTQDGGDAELARACDALNGNQESAATTEVQLGILLRPMPQSPLQPYFKAQAGVAFTPTSSVLTVSEYAASFGRHSRLTIYPDDSMHAMRPSWTAAFGISTSPQGGHQWRVEVRESWLRVNVVTGPTTLQGMAPPTKSVLKGFPSIVLGFDVVYGRDHGRSH